MAGQKQNVATDKPRLNIEGFGGGRGDENWDTDLGHKYHTFLLPISSLPI